MKIKNLSMLMIASIALISLSSCEKDAEPQNPNKVNYALSTTGGTWPNQTTYLFGTNQFPSGTLGTSTAAELASSGSMYKYGSDIYMTTFGAPATLRKYTYDSTGRPQEVGSFSIAGLKTFGAVEFVSATEAYAAANGFGGVPKLVKFNPTNMQIITTVNLTGLSKSGATEVYYLGMVIRDNFIYMGVNYQDANFSNLEDKVFVGIINRTSNTVEKLIEDDRSSEMWNGGTSASFSPNCLIKDENNDIYVTGYANNGKPSGILRIKNGTTVFDPTYFFNLSTVTGKPCLGLYHFGNGLTFTIRYSDPVAYPFDTDANYDSYAAGEIYKIDLTAKTSSGNISTTLPKIFGNNTFMTKWDNDKIYFNVSAASSNSIYSYKINGGTVAKEFDLSSGTCNGFTKIN
ncbi:conserved exported hypothetical protein [Flavobacterium psychrophilum]|uniref:DUF4374 domain-containing protein n=1 Tax=Flavobacterium psychrophilum TaxID=96345 RepID=UPI000B7C2B70|nr:DUF4374 domain-containing protein [Flavobacterium psychrophilum]SNB44197.1 conserved exported hypothetical protein [Flavobacterium psychrophilum]